MTKQEAQVRRLGKTDIEVTPIGLGVMQFSGTKGVFRFMFPDVSQEDQKNIVRAAIEGGINWFDTAEMYGGGASERGLANALQAMGKKNGEVVIGTKWMPLLRTAGNIPRTIENRIRFLDGYEIDLYMVHQPWSFSSPEAEMDAMADLVEQGKIRSVGVSNFDAPRMRRAHAALQKRGLPLAVNQVQYSLLRREIETNGILETAKELGVTIVAWGPLASGLLTGKFHQDPQRVQSTPIGRRMRFRGQIEQTRLLIDALAEIGSQYDATPAQVALNWLIHFQGDAVVAIPGASKVQQAEESAGAMQFRLSEQDMARLDALSKELG